MDMRAVLYGIVGHDNRFLVQMYVLQAMHSPVDTVADAAASLRKIHDMICGCDEGSSLAEHVWLTNLMPPRVESNVFLQDYFPSEAERVPGDAVLADLLAGELRPQTVVMFGNSDASARCGRFDGVGRLAGDVCRVAYRPTVSPPVTSSFEEILATPGTCYVDMPERIERWYFSNRHKKMPIIRRPSGYGMTTFLSMCATTFTRRGGDVRLPCQRIWDEHAAQWRRPRPVLSLDFAELYFCADSGGMLLGREEMVSRADAYMRATAAAFCARYLPQRAPAFDDPFTPYHWAIMTVLRQLGTQVFLTIDNYTTPFLRVGGTAFSAIEDVIWERVLGPLLDPSAGIVLRGLVVGPALHGLRPFASYPWFADVTEDLSDSAEYASAIGFTSADVLDLSRAVLGDKPGVVESVVAALRLRPNDRAIFCARDVVRILRVLQAGDVPTPDDYPNRIYPGSYDDRVDMDLDGDDIADVPAVQPSQSHESAFLESKTPLQPELDVGVSKSLVPALDELQIDD